MRSLVQFRKVLGLIFSRLSGKLTSSNIVKLLNPLISVIPSSTTIDLVSAL